MAEVQWIKVSADIYDNRKIKQIDAMPNGDAIMNVWYKLLTLAGRINRGGKLMIADGVPYTDEMLAAEFRRPTETVHEALQVFLAFRMIEKRGKVWTVKNWEKHQNAEGLDAIRKYENEKKKKYRAGQKKHQDDNMSTDKSEDKSTDKTEMSTDKSEDTAKEKRSKREKGDIDKDKDKEYISPSYDVEITRAPARDLGGDGGGNASGFVPPTVDQVEAYCAEKGLIVDPYRFVEYYSAPERSWRGVTDWRARLMSWHRKDAEDAKAKKRGDDKQMHSSFETSDAFEAAMRKSYGDQFFEQYIAGGESDG